MATIKHLTLDVLKPHAPNALEFALALAGPGYRVQVKVQEVDEKTETLQVQVDGEDIDFDHLRSAIDGQGGSLHSIDEVEVQGPAEGP